jgi:hypothetical protein
MMKSSDATLVQRTGYLYRQLLLLQRLFQLSGENEDADWLGTGCQADALALCAGIREVLDELADQARMLTKIPYPLSEWRPGDGADDDRWRALTEVERREVLSLVTGYETLISWAEGLARPESDLAERTEPRGDADGLARTARRNSLSTSDYLKEERSRIARFRQEMGFLDRRRIAETL